MTYAKELLRPWKLATFAIGMTWLVWGAFHYGYGDWDIGISLIMGGLCYVTAPWSASVVFYRQCRMLPLALVFWLITVDGVYVAYHRALGNDMMRMENFFASTALYWLCGFIWLYPGSVKELLATLRSLRTRDLE